MKILAKTGAKGEPMATPSIWLQNLLLKIKWVCYVAKRKSFLSSFLVMFRLGSWLKLRFVAISMGIVGSKKFSGKICILNLGNSIYHDIYNVITKPNKGNRVVILDWKLYDNAIQETISDISKLKSSIKIQPWNVKLHYNVFR